jgi:hypothetical protein
MHCYHCGKEGTAEEVKACWWPLKLKGPTPEEDTVVHFCSWDCFVRRETEDGGRRARMSKEYAAREVLAGLAMGWMGNGCNPASAMVSIWKPDEEDPDEGRQESG